MQALTLRTRLIAAGRAAATLWGIGAGAWVISQSLAPLIFFGYPGTIIAPGILFYLSLPPGKRIAGRRDRDRDARCGAGARSRSTTNKNRTLLLLLSQSRQPGDAPEKRLLAPHRLPTLSALSAYAACVSATSGASVCAAVGVAAATP